MTKIGFLTFLLAFAGPSVSHANWQYTRWGMTPEEVEAAAPTPLIQEPNSVSPSGPPMRQTPYLAEGMELKARFVFDEKDRLISVALEPSHDFDEGNVQVCNRLNNMLSSRYGFATKGESNDAAQTEKWRDEKNGNTIDYTFFSGIQSCWISYQPIITDNGL